MIWRFLAVTFVVALTGGATADGVPEDLSFIQSMIEPYEDCKFGKLSCSKNCTQVLICLGGDDLEVIEVCPEGTLCDSTTNSCSADLKKCNLVDETDFTCHGTKGGKFPNPYDCHSYFICADDLTTTQAPSTTDPTTTTSAATTDPTATTSAATTDPTATTSAATTDPTATTTAATTDPTATTTAATTAGSLPQQFLEDSRVVNKGNYTVCARNTTAYDALSGTCRFSSNHRVCKEGPVPKCITQLQSGGLIENPNIYYVCVSVGGVLQPLLAKCAQATDVFENGKCITPSDYLHQPRWVGAD